MVRVSTLLYINLLLKFRSASVKRKFHVCRAYVHEVGLYGLLQGQTPSLTRISLIYECFTSATAALADSLDQSLDDMADWGVVDWRSLNLAVMLSTKASIVLDAAGATPRNESSQRAAWLGKTLDTLCARVRELHRLAVGIGEDDAGGGPDHFLKRMATEWTNVKIYYQSCIQKCLSQAMAAAATGQTTNPPQPHQPQPQHPHSQPQQTSLQQPQPPHPQSSLPLQPMEFPFEVDPFNDMFWLGFAESEALLNNNFQM